MKKIILFLIILCDCFNASADFFSDVTSPMNSWHPANIYNHSSGLINESRSTKKHISPSPSPAEPCSRSNYADDWPLDGIFDILNDTLDDDWQFENFDIPDNDYQFKVFYILDDNGFTRKEHYGNKIIAVILVMCFLLAGFICIYLNCKI